MSKTILSTTSDRKIPVSSKIEFTGEVEYPVHVSIIDLNRAYMGRIHWNWHPEIEICIIEQGSATFYWDDTEITLHAGQGFFMNQNVMHSITPAPPEEECHMYSVLFHPSYLFGYGNSVFTGKYIVPLLNEPSLRTLVLDPDDTLQKDLLTLTQHIITANTEKDFGYEIVTKSDLCQIWLLLLEYYTPLVNDIQQIATVNPDELRTKEIMRYIEAQYAEKITLDDLSSHVHISKSECCRCVKRCLNMTPVEYLMKYRIFRAASMIQCNDPMAASFSDLAFSVGFNNVSYFNKVFRQYLNCTPGEYRKNLKQSASFYPFNNGTFY